MRWWVVTEHGATFAVRPGVDALRPPQRTPVDGLFLAGDWTDTGWPATMEGAVRSGYLAAEGILEDLGRPASIVRPELPTEPLAALAPGADCSGPSAEERLPSRPMSSSPSSLGSPLARASGRPGSRESPRSGTRSD